MVIQGMTEVMTIQNVDSMDLFVGEKLEIVIMHALFRLFMNDTLRL